MHCLSLSDSGEPCGLHRRSWRVGHPFQPQLCSIPQPHESIATSVGSLKHGRPSLGHRTWTTSPCFTRAETGSIGWGLAHICREMFSLNLKHNTLNTSKTNFLLLHMRKTASWLHDLLPSVSFSHNTPYTVYNSVSPTPAVCVCMSVFVRRIHPPSQEGLQIMIWECLSGTRDILLICVCG